MGNVVFHATGRKFALDGFTRPAGAGTVWTSSLNHEVRHDPVERESVIEALICELYEIGDRDGRGFGV